MIFMLHDTDLYGLLIMILMLYDTDIDGHITMIQHDFHDTELILLHDPSIMIECRQ